MAGTKPAGVTARKLARERMAAAHQARRQRDEDNTSDLAAFFRCDERIGTAETKRDTAISAAHAAFASAEAGELDAQAAILRRITDRGTSRGELVELTGLTSGQIGKLLKRQASPASEPAGGSASAERSAENRGGDDAAQLGAGLAGGSDAAGSTDTGAASAPAAAGSSAPLS